VRYLLIVKRFVDADHPHRETVRRRCEERCRCDHKNSTLLRGSEKLYASKSQAHTQRHLIPSTTLVALHCTARQAQRSPVTGAHHPYMLTPLPTPPVCIISAPCLWRFPPPAPPSCCCCCPPAPRPPSWPHPLQAPPLRPDCARTWPC
jgi:hypothetical protein